MTTSSLNSRLLLVAIVTAACGLAGCGSNKSQRSAATTSQQTTTTHTSSPPPVQPQAKIVAIPPKVLLARVGSYRITGATFNRWLVAEVRTEPASGGVAPVPPTYSACIAHLAIVAQQRSTPLPSQAARKKACQDQYGILRKQIMSRLISNQWLINGAAEAGVPVSNAEAKQKLVGQSGSEAKIKASLASAGHNLPDDLLAVRANLSEQAIRTAIKESVGPMTPARISSYYEQNRQRFAVPERRDVEIVRTATKATALKVKHEIAAGKSFASVVKGISLAQPIFTKEGLVTGLKPHTYTQKALDQAIFTARTEQLRGPVKIVLGYYVFRVKRISAGHQKTLSEVEASIKQSLPEELEKKALVAFIKQWRARWTSRTDCEPGYVVRKCKQFKAPKTTAGSEDLYTLD